MVRSVLRTLHDLASFNLIRIYIRVPRFVYSQSLWFGSRPGHALAYQNVAPGVPVFIPAEGKTRALTEIR